MSESMDSGGFDGHEVRKRVWKDACERSARRLETRVSCIRQESDRNRTGVETILGWLLEEFGRMDEAIDSSRKSDGDASPAHPLEVQWISEMRLLQHQLYSVVGDVLDHGAVGILSGRPRLDVHDDDSCALHTNAFIHSLQVRHLSPPDPAEYVRRFGLAGDEVQSAAHRLRSICDGDLPPSLPKNAR